MASPVLVPELKHQDLSSIVKGPKREPDRWMLIGTEGIGKSTFGAEAPRPIFLCAESGVHQIGPDRFPEPRSWPEVLASVETLRREAHEYETLIVDSVDWVEPMMHTEICRRDGVETIERVGGGYGKGYTIALDEWRKFLALLDRLRSEKRMEIGFLAHAQVKNFANPAGPDYSRYVAAINEKAYNVVKQWLDSVLFAVYEEVTTDPKHGRVKGVATGARVVHTARTAAWDAKNRYSLPPTLPLSYADYAEARAAGLQVNEEELIAESLALINQMGLGEKAAKYLLTLRGNPAELVRGLNRLKVKAAEAGVAS